MGLVVYNGGEAVDLDSYTCTIEATRTDGTAITAAVTTNGNIGAFVTTATMTNQADKYMAKLVLFDSNSRRVASLAFIMCVTPKTMDENAESIEEDASLYQQYTGTVQTLIADIREDITDLKNQKIQRYDTVADMIADTSLKVGMYVRTGGYAAVNDGGGMLYRISDDYDYYERYETLENGLYAIRVFDIGNTKYVLDMPTNGNPYSGVGNNGASAITALLEVCASYEDNNDHLYYGHYSALDYGIHDMSLGLSDGKYQIDCSAFVQLAIAGIGYSSSRYNGGVNAFSTIYSYFPYLTDAEYQTQDRYAPHRLTYELAQFAYKNGLTFKPNMDWSNVQPGDVVYLQDGDSPSPQWGQIDHCMIYIGRKGKNDSLYFYEAGGNSSHIVSKSSAGVVHVCERTFSFMQSNTKLVSRFPLGNASGTPAECTIEGATPTFPITFSAGQKSPFYPCKEIKAGEWYTVILTVGGSNRPFYTTDQGHLSTTPGHGGMATYVQTHRATTDFYAYRIGSSYTTDTDIIFYDFKIVKGYSNSKMSEPVAPKIALITPITGSYQNTSANAWENTGISITVPQYHKYLVSVDTYWTNGKPIGLGLDSNASLSSLPPRYCIDRTEAVQSTPTFMLPPGKHYVYSKRSTAPAENAYTINAIDLGIVAGHL